MFLCTYREFVFTGLLFLITQLWVPGDICSWQGECTAFFSLAYLHTSPTFLQSIIKWLSWHDGLHCQYALISVMLQHLAAHFSQLFSSSCSLSQLYFSLFGAVHSLATLLGHLHLAHCVQQVMTDGDTIMFKAGGRAECLLSCVVFWGLLGVCKSKSASQDLHWSHTCVGHLWCEVDTSLDTPSMQLLMWQDTIHTLITMQCDSTRCDSAQCDLIQYDVTGQCKGMMVCNHILIIS